MWLLYSQNSDSQPIFDRLVTGMAKLSVPQSLSRAKSLEKKGELQKAQQIYRQILQAFPNNLRASQALSALTVKSSNRGLSQADLDHLGKLYSQEDYDRLIKDTNTMLSKFPKSFMLWNILGAAHKARLDFGEAENAFRQACQINPDNLDSQMNLGDVLLTLNRHNEAEPCFERALKIKPRFNEAYQKLGIVKARQQFYQDAVFNFQKALAQNPSSSDVKTKLARAYFELNEPAKATELLSALWTEGYRSLDYLHVLSQRQLSFPNLDINSELDDLIKLDSDLLSNSEGMIAFIRGRAYALAGKHEKAFEHLKLEIRCTKRNSQSNWSRSWKEVKKQPTL